LNLATKFTPTSFEESTSHDEWKEFMQEYDALIKNRTWKLVDPPFGTNQLDASGSSRTSTNKMAHLISTK
jgi:hypothetical protein